MNQIHKRKFNKYKDENGEWVFIGIEESYIDMINSKQYKYVEIQSPELERPSLNPLYQHNAPKSITSKNIIQKVWLWIASNIFKFIVTVLTALFIAYLIYRLGWN